MEIIIKVFTVAPTRRSISNSAALLVMAIMAQLQ